MTLPTPTPEERTRRARVSTIVTVAYVLLAVVFAVAGAMGVPNTWVGITLFCLMAAMNASAAIVDRRKARRKQQEGPQ